MPPGNGSVGSHPINLVDGRIGPGNVREPRTVAADTTQAVALLRRAHSLYHTLGVPEAIEIQNLLSTLDKHTG